MLDNILIVLILFSIVLSFFIVKVWKKKKFVKELYISEGVSIAERCRASRSRSGGLC